MTIFSSAPDFPPESQQWRRDVETAVNSNQDATALIKGEVAAQAAVQDTQTVVAQPDVVNAGILLGDPPTIYPEPFAYFTRNGYTFGAVSASWDYRSATGEILGGQADRYQVGLREVRVESDYPVFADMRVDPPPTGDSQIVAETESTYAVINRLDVLTTYAIKVRSITATGTPGVWSEEVEFTTPKEPKVRPIDPPILEQCDTDVCVTWDWTQYFTSGTPGYPDVMGFNATSAPVTLTGDEKIYHIATAPNGNIYVRIQGTGSLRYRVIYPDGTNASFDGSKFLTTSGAHFEVHFAAGPDGNLYSLTRNQRSAGSTSGYYKLANVADAAPDPDPLESTEEVLWTIFPSSDTLTATARVNETWYQTAFSANKPTFAVTQPVSHTSGIAWLVVSDYFTSSSFQHSLRVLDTGSGTSALTTLSGAADLRSGTSYLSSKLFRLDATHLAYPIASSDGNLGSEPPQNPLNDSRDYIYQIAFIDTALNTCTIRSITPPPGWANRFHVEAINGALYAKEEGSGGSGQTCRLDYDGISAYAAAPLNAGGYSDYFATSVGGWIVGTVAPSRYSGVLYNGLTFYNTATGYAYRVTATWSAPGSYGTPVTTHNLMSLSGDLTYVWDNSPDAANANITRADAEMGILPDGRAWLVGHLGAAFLTPLAIAGDPGSPPTPLNDENPWPEIKYVIAQRLTLSGWIDVGQYSGPGTLRDPVPPGTYQYRLVPVSYMGERGDPTAAVTVTVT